MIELAYADRKALQVEAINIVQHGLADVMAWVGEPVLPWPNDNLKVWREYLDAFGPPPQWRHCPHPSEHKTGAGGCYCMVCGFCWHHTIQREEGYGWCVDCFEQRDICKW